MANTQITVTRIRFDKFYGDSGNRCIVALTQNGARLSSTQAPINTVVHSTDIFGSPVTILISSVVENSLKSGDLSKTLFNAEILRSTPAFMEFALRVREVVACEHESETQFNSAKSQGHIPARVPNASVPASTPQAPAGSVVANLQQQAESFI